jgi:hypothetical protein
MTTRADYTDAEWALLLDIPPAVGTAVMVAGRSGLGTTKEAITLANQLFAPRSGYEGVELIEALVEARAERGEKSSIETLASPYRGKEPEEVRADALAKCRKVASLLDQKATADEAEAFKNWATTTAQRVAEAASEGGVFGIVGHRVSDDEQRLLEAIEGALDGE